MQSFLFQLENMGLSRWIREGGTLTGYPLILFLHTMGMGVLVGLNTTIDLRIVGFAPRIPIKTLERTYPLMWTGFAVNLTTGTLLFISDAVKHFSNPVFWVKLGFITAALVTLKRIRTKVFQDPRLDKEPVRTSWKILAAASLACWFFAITAGRLMAYLYEILVY
jgi:hypothetical protein